jgi:hypothetical protein
LGVLTADKIKEHRSRLSFGSAAWKARLINPIWFTAIRIASGCAVALLFSFNTARATEDELARALREDQQLCSTPEGVRYEAKFLAAVSPKTIAAIISCTGSNYEFDMALRISSEGKITRIVCTPHQPVAECAAAKLKGLSGPRPLGGPCTIFGHYSSKSN